MQFGLNGKKKISRNNLTLPDCSVDFSVNYFVDTLGYNCPIGPSAITLPVVIA